jgi:hypothetical protein
MSTNYQRVPNEETIEMKDASKSPGSPRIAAGHEEPPSQLKVTAVVVFYLIAAIVVR